MAVRHQHRYELCTLIAGHKYSRRAERRRIPRSTLLVRLPSGARAWPTDWSGPVSLSWILVALGLIAAVIAVQFDEPWLEIGGAAAFVLLFAWVVVALRLRTGSVKSTLAPRSHSSISRTPTVRRQKS